MDENTITADILDAAVKLHRRFGPGMLETIYEQLLEAELVRRGHVVGRQKNVSFDYDGIHLENAFRVDLLVDNLVIVELKAAEQMKPVFAKQVKTYLIAMDLRVGILLNFGMATVKEGYVRIVNGYTATPTPIPLTPLARSPFHDLHPPIPLLFPSFFPPSAPLPLRASACHPPPCPPFPSPPPPPPSAPLPLSVSA